MNIQEILTQLKAPNEKLPYDALQAALEHQEQMIPELLQIIEHAKDDFDYLWDHPDYLGHIYAMYLLARFREKSAYPLIVDFTASLSNHEDPFLEVTEDITSNLGRILASVCGGDDSLIKSLIENEQAYQYARSEAIGALVSLVHCGEKSREEVLAYFQTLFREKIKRESSNDSVWNNLVQYSTALYPDVVHEDIKQAYADKLVDTRMISLEHVENQLKLGLDRVLKRLPRKYSLIDDAIADMERGIYSLRSENDQEVSTALVELTINTGDFPHEALKNAITYQKEVTPRLLGLLESHEQHAYEMRGQDNLILYIYAMCLLAQFRETRAYPIIVNFLSLPENIAVELTGDDVVTEVLHRILASVYDGNDTLLKSLIEDAEVSGIVRTAALKAFLVLVACEQKTRDEVMTYFQSLFRGKLERKLSPVWGGLINCSTELYPEEVYEDIHQVYAENLVEEFELGLEDVQETHALDKNEVLERFQNNDKYSLIEDLVKEMQDWAFVNPSKKKKPEPRYSKPRTGPKIGRNEPCPCGSGQKYKKCCGK